MKAKLILFTFFGILILSSLVSAQEYDVSVSVSPKEATLRPCGIGTFDIEVENTGELKDEYDIAVEGIEEGWYSLSQDHIELESGESGTIYLFVTPYCYGPTGTFNVSVTASDKASDTDYFTLNVVPDHILKLEMPGEVRACLREETVFEASVKNEGEFTEEVLLIASENASTFISLSTENFTLEPGQEENVTITVDPEEIGDYTLELEARSTTSYARSKDSTLISVIECYKVNVTYPEEVEACRNVSTPFNITLKNVGIKRDSYELRIEALDYSELVDLEPEESETLVSSFIEEEVGDYPVNFTVESDFISFEGKILFRVVKCYDVDLSLEELEFQVEVGRGKLITAVVENLGTKADTFEILSDVDWVSIKPERVSLESQESEDVFVYFSPEYGLLGTQNTTLTARSEKSQDTEKIKIEIVEVLKPVTTTTVPIGVTTTTVPVNVTVPQIPTAGAVGILERIWANRTVRSLLIAVIIVIIILIIIYLVVMR